MPESATAEPFGRQAPSNTLKFEPESVFHRDLKDRVKHYFDSTGLSPKASGATYLKTVVILSWFSAAYVALVFLANEWWQGALAAVALGLSVSGIGFSIQHDANHQAYSRHRWLNELLGHSLDLVGGSSYVWRFKHNIIHHTYPNVAGADDDVDFQPFVRLAPNQPRRGLHRFQHIYLWFLYAFLAPKWHFVDDFKNLSQGRIAAHRLPRPRGRALVFLILGKVSFVIWAFVVPALIHPWWWVVGGYLVVASITGVTLAAVFQLAHCVEEADFPEVQPGNVRIGTAWAEHQVRTAVDFAPNSRLLTWFLGGLNFQVVHHLFPHVCHAHYPQLARIVAATCAEHGVTYRVQPTFAGALRSHGRWLRRMGAATA